MLICRYILMFISQKCCMFQVFLSDYVLIVFNYSFSGKPCGTIWKLPFEQPLPLNPYFLSLYLASLTLNCNTIVF